MLFPHLISLGESPRGPPARAARRLCRPPPILCILTSSTIFLLLFFIARVLFDSNGYQPCFGQFFLPPLATWADSPCLTRTAVTSPPTIVFSDSGSPIPALLATCPCPERRFSLLFPIPRHLAQGGFGAQGVFGVLPSKVRRPPPTPRPACG